MGSKSRDLKEIWKQLNENYDACSAVDIWLSSYYLITVEEFVRCSDWNVDELLEILDEKVLMLSSAREIIKNYKDTNIKE
jgi:hypothetical protein